MQNTGNASNRHAIQRDYPGHSGRQDKEIQIIIKSEFGFESKCDSGS